MERLTFDGNFCDIAMCTRMRGGENCKGGNCSQRDVWERLKAYEDTGLEPSEISTGLETANVFAAMQELKRYKSAEKQGLLVRLPCKVGSTIYVIPSAANYGINKISYPQNNRVHVQTVEAILWCSNSQYLLRTCTGQYEALSDEFGVTWFLNPQDAEKALEELENA